MISDTAKSAAAVGALMACNLLSVVMAKVVAGRFPVQMEFSKLLLLLVYVGIWGSTYLFRLILWMIVGKKYQLSFIYPIMELNFFLTYLVGILFWGERFSWLQMGGLASIYLGVLIITTSSHRLNQPETEKKNG